LKGRIDRGSKPKKWGNNWNDEFGTGKRKDKRNDKRTVIKTLLETGRMKIVSKEKKEKSLPYERKGKRRGGK